MKRSDTTEMIIIVTVNFHRESTKNSVNNKQLKSNETMVKTTVDNALGFRIKNIIIIIIVYCVGWAST